jgi:hypothetical protein
MEKFVFKPMKETSASYPGGQNAMSNNSNGSTLASLESTTDKANQALHQTWPRQ